MMLSYVDVYYSRDFQEYALILDEAAAFFYAEQALLVQLERQERERVDALRTMPYREYLRTPEWLERARRTRARAGGRCWTCNRAGPLEVHHRTYERRGDEDEDDLIALCPRCHAIFDEWGGLAEASN